MNNIDDASCKRIDEYVPYKSMNDNPIDIVGRVALLGGDADPPST